MANKHRQSKPVADNPMTDSDDTPLHKRGWVSAVVGVVMLGLAYYRPEARLQQDIYQSQADCKADWEQEELCQAESSSGSSGSGGRWRGPAYYEDNREVETRNGKKIRPKTNRSSDKPVPLKGSVMDAISRPVKRGGFGSNGTRSSGG